MKQIEIFVMVVSCFVFLNYSNVYDFQIHSLKYCIFETVIAGNFSFIFLRSASDESAALQTQIKQPPLTLQMVQNLVADV